MDEVRRYGTPSPGHRPGRHTDLGGNVGLRAVSIIHDPADIANNDIELSRHHPKWLVYLRIAQSSPGVGISHA